MRFIQRHITPLVINSLGHGHTRTRTHILTIRTGSISKTHGKTRLVQYVITAKNPFKTSIDALQVMLLNFKKCIPQDFHLLALSLHPCIRSTSSRRKGPVFATMQVANWYLITHMLF